ncbi:hypothetical protein [Alkaliphilus hydrothermalis]|uniref:Uncharacterized protein n=1 Tax=Alkaliphilus hydrothermalis TaxID=1482730 RepID=A0ABS2NT13_9FIRM|nr:hypothetical protein [Alkaliphilus hydrothermalis]MBM7616087.1 hypothetical protein [Alkaliphilus hydrothermalis]
MKKSTFFDLIFSLMIGAIGVYLTILISINTGHLIHGDEEVYGVFLVAISILIGVVIGCSSLIYLRLSSLSK